MNRMYHNEFKGLDGVLYRMDISSDQSGTDTRIKSGGTPFILRYEDVTKLEPIRTGQATMRLISETDFQFTGLHTDDMQGFRVDFFRNNTLYWTGWIDSELYTERLSESAPYEVEFSAADFNVLERLMYRDSTGGKYTDVTTMFTHLTRCLSSLGLPFEKLYIGCSTTPDGVTMGASDTVLHVLYVMSANFYDEDGDPMSCREVIESVLRPFGLMMVQKDGNVYIYDYNTIAQGLPMKRYDFGTWTYEASETVGFYYGNVPEIGIMSTEGDYGFETMYNNVTITSSLYGESGMVNVDITESSLQSLVSSDLGRDFNKYIYSYNPGIENITGEYILYQRDGEEDIVGASLDYDPTPNALAPVYRIKYPNYIIGSSELFFVNLKLQAYVNTRENPYLDSSGVTDNPNTGTLKLYCNLYMTDESGNILRYLDLINDNGSFWVDTPNGEIQQGRCLLWISNESAVSGSVVDSWVGNANVYNPMNDRLNIETITSAGMGIDVPSNGSYGYLVFEITNKARVVNPTDDDGNSTDGLLDSGLVQQILINNISMEFLDTNHESISTDDYSFRSYINKNVKSDLGEITLKCISANEEMAPVGKANILRRSDNGYSLQLAYTRSGQTDILERLLMCTIHSNYSQKNEKFSVGCKIAGNPVLSYIGYSPVLSGKYLVSGCDMDFRAGRVSINAIGYSMDTAKLSDIPYD